MLLSCWYFVAADVKILLSSYSAVDCFEKNSNDTNTDNIFSQLVHKIKYRLPLVKAVSISLEIIPLEQYTFPRPEVTQV